MYTQYIDFTRSAASDIKKNWWCYKLGHNIEFLIQSYKILVLILYSELIKKIKPYFTI